MKSSDEVIVSSRTLTRIFEAWQTHISVIVGIILYCFVRTLRSYFLADDFGEVCYVSKIFAGDWSLFWSNFTGNFMQIPSMCVYRPWLLCSLMIDFLFWKANATGYFLTNIAHFTGCSLLIYGVTREITKTWSHRRSSAAALVAALLFAASPLHCESISWVVGRVDIVSCFYYLLSFYLMLRSQSSANRVTKVLALASFWMALMTKEMAIGLPVLVTAYAFFKQSGYGANNIISQMVGRARTAMAVSLPFWCVTAFYFVVRFLTLKTLTGGYVGSIGAGQQASILTKWCDRDSWMRIAFPLNHSVFGDSSNYVTLLTLLYYVVVLAVGAKILASGFPKRLTLFLCVWAATTLAPIYQLFGLGYDLEGARFVFFFTVPLSILIPIILFASHGSPGKDLLKIDRKIMAVGGIALAIIIGTFSRIAYKNNSPWLEAGRQTKAVQQQAMALSQRLSADKTKAVLFGVPKDAGGAHMVLNGHTLRMMLAAPFVAKDASSDFITFDPILFGDSELINTTRLKQILSSSKSPPIFVWNFAKRQFDEVSIAAASSNALEIRMPDSTVNVLPSTGNSADLTISGNSMHVSKCTGSSAIRISPMSLSPLDADYLQLSIRGRLSAKSDFIRVHWKGSPQRVRTLAQDVDSSAPQTDQISKSLLPAAFASEPNQSASIKVSMSNFASKAGANQAITGNTEVVENANCTGGTSTLRISNDQISDYSVVRIPLSKYWRWFTCGTIQTLEITLPTADWLDVADIKLCKANLVSPQIELIDSTESDIGLWNLAEGRTKLAVSADSVAGAQKVRVDFGKTNYFFEDSVDKTTSAGVQSQKILDLSDRILLDKAPFEQSGYHQIRAICLDANGSPIGEFSDPIILQTP